MNHLWKYKTFVVSALIALILPVFSLGHGGGLDKQGGHRQSGVYHCHRDSCNSPSITKQFETVSTSYNRKSWKHWSDEDGDCQNTRQELLQAQSIVSVQYSSSGCTVVSGQWVEPFLGKTYTDSQDLDIDHVIPLKWASDHGGLTWNSDLKEQFANDIINLLVVDDGQNQSKGAQGPIDWMPINRSYHCEYLNRWDEVMNQYPLQVTSLWQETYNLIKNSACTY